MTDVHVAAIVATLLGQVAGATPPAPAPLRIAITPVLVERQVGLNAEFIAYLGEKLRTEAVLVQRRSYRQVEDLLERSEVDVAFTCGLPYVVDHDRLGVELLASPALDEGPVYYSYVIVPADGPARSLEGLRGKRFAFTDPLSNSGWLVPAHELARGGDTAETFFGRTIFTYSHAASVEAVAERFVDGASVDSYVYEVLRRVRPALVEQTRIVARLGPHPFPPLVARRGLPPATKAAVRAVLLGMDRDPAGRELLSRMGFRRFVVPEDRSFDAIRAMSRAVSARYAAAGGAPRAAAR